MSDHVCPTCGADLPDRLGLWGMYDNHTTKRYWAATVDDLIEQWRADIAADPQSIISLCPISVLARKKELRRVGEMLHPDWKARPSVPKDEAAVERYRAAALADPDITRLMKGTAS